MIKIDNNRFTTDAFVKTDTKNASLPFILDTGATSSVISLKTLEDKLSLKDITKCLIKIEDKIEKDEVLEEIIGYLRKCNFQIEILQVEKPEYLSYLLKHYKEHTSIGYSGTLELNDLLLVPTFIFEDYRITNVVFSISRHAIHNLIGMNILKLFDMQLSIGTGNFLFKLTKNWKKLSEQDKFPIGRIFEQSNIKQVNAFNRPNIKP